MNIVPVGRKTDRVRDGETLRDDEKETDEQTTLAFAASALQDLRTNEEMVLAWESDNRNAVDALPALF